MERTDVLVVGAGPTGLSLAALLTRTGTDVRIIDAAVGPARESSRATTVHAATLCQLDLLDGAGRQIADRAAHAFHNAVWHGRRRIATVHWNRLPQPYSFMANLRQEETEAILHDRLTAAGCAVSRGVEFVSLDTSGPRPVATLTSDSGQRTVEARYVVGCDGAHSTVRGSVGVTMDGTTHEERFLLADVSLRTGLDRDHTHVFVSTRGVLAVMPMPDGSFRLNGTLAGDEEATADSLPELMAARLGAVVDRVALGDVAWSSTYRTHSRIARRYRVGPVFLAGDAAHLVSPVGGQGMNLGIQDAVNLGWKLACVLRHSAPEGLLDTYAAERRQVGERALRTTERSSRMLTARKPLERLLRNLAMRGAQHLRPVQHALTWEPSGMQQAYASTAVARAPGPGAFRPGRQFVAGAATQQAPMKADAGSVSFRLLTGASAHPGFAAVAGRHGVSLAPAGLPKAGRDSAAALVRPDGFIGWFGDDPHDLEMYLAAVLGSGGG